MLSASRPPRESPSRRRICAGENTNAIVWAVRPDGSCVLEDVLRPPGLDAAIASLVGRR